MGTMVAAFFVICLAIVGVSEADYPFRDPSLPFEDRVAVGIQLERLARQSNSF